MSRVLKRRWHSNVSGSGLPRRETRPCDYEAYVLLNRTFKPANEAIQRLVEAGILRQVNVGRRNRAYEAPEIIAAFTSLERQLASPEGDTRTSSPVRSVPEQRE